tara:strand:+ start:5654 stop:5806 length:153 start_codon:yes stop_codon:yes gene_type:complete
MFWEDSDDKPAGNLIGVWLGGFGTRNNLSSGSETFHSYREFIISSKKQFK